jgi:hypothetical protein
VHATQVIIPQPPALELRQGIMSRDTTRLKLVAAVGVMGGQVDIYTTHAMRKCALKTTRISAEFITAHACKVLGLLARSGR